MTDPITIHVSTGAEGLELVEALARRGLPAALVSQPSGWTVEIVTRDERRPVLLHEATVALESAAGSLGARSLPIRVSSRGYDVRPHLDVVARPLAPGERPPDAGAPGPAGSAPSPVDRRTPARSRELREAADRQPRSLPATLAPAPRLGRGPRLVSAPARSLDVRATRPFDRLDDGCSGAGGQ